mmetsp:Transcript_73596/g.130512  ORF Transcript_73596/g.130512 Transcript_73596/m.130512 type:complete len:404 (+) Transcript_73596:69-1280(+)
MFDFDDLEDHLEASAAPNRIWAVSDIHTDAKDNLDFVERLDPKAYAKDALILAGDVSDNLEVVRKTLRSLRAKFAYVFFVPGNHDLWVTRQKAKDNCHDSLSKMSALERICQEERVDTRPRRLLASREGASSVWIVPLLSWHCQSFDTEPDIDKRWRGIPEVEAICSDYELCAWPGTLDPRTDAIAEKLDQMNDKLVMEMDEANGTQLNALIDGRVRTDSGDIIISFSHFLPRIELLPEKRYLYMPSLAKMVGSPLLGRRVERMQPHVHIFGHTHFGWDQVLEGIRYVSPPMGMPRERDQRLSTIATGQFPIGTVHDDQPAAPLFVWSQTAGFAPRYAAGWSGFYDKYPREPEQVLVLPDYVASIYRWDERAHGSKAEVTGWQGKEPPWIFGPTWTKARKRHA